MAKLILVTAINPTPAGEGKTTTMIGLSQALNKLGKKSVVAMREPSSRSMFWRERGCCWWRLCASGANGRHQSAFYW